MDEIISGVQVIKMYAWEKPFCALVELARKLELKVVRKSSYIRGIFMTFNLFTTRMALYCTIVTILLFNKEKNLTSSEIFVFSSYFNIMAHTMSGMFVRGFAEIAECLVAVKRLQNFLMFEEFEKGNVTNVALSSNLNGKLNSNLKNNITSVSKQDLPYIDDDLLSYQNSNGKNEGENKQSGILMVADDLLKNELTDSEKEETINKR